MKLKHFWMVLVAVIFTVTSCNNDDDGNSLLPQDEQNQVDDAAIILYLQKHYFNSVGKVVAFDDDDTSDDNETPLYNIAQQGTTGYWYVLRPNFEANGRAVTNKDNDSILLQYEMKTFFGRKKNDSIYYSTPSIYSSTINASGLPIWDPSFYNVALTQEQIDANTRKSWYEIEGFEQGIKHFNSVNKAATDAPFVNFQGMIIVPSRLAFKRDRNALGMVADTSVMFNFELYQVIDRE